MVQPGIQYFYNNQWQNLILLTNDQNIYYKNRTHCINKYKFEVIQTIPNTSFQEIYDQHKDQYINNGFFENFTGIDISQHQTFNKSLIKYKDIVDNWFLEHDEPPKSSSESNNMNDIHYLWYRLINSPDNAYTQLIDYIKTQYNITVQPQIQKVVGVPDQNKFNELVQWFNENKRWPTLNDVSPITKFNIHSFTYDIIKNNKQLNITDQQRQTILNFQQQYSSRQNYQQTLFDKMKAYIQSQLEQNPQLTKITTPSDDQAKQFGFVKRNWQDVFGEGQKSQRQDFKKTKQQLQQTFPNVELCNSQPGFQKKDTITRRQMIKIYQENKIGDYTKKTNQEMFEDLKNRGLIPKEFL